MTKNRDKKRQSDKQRGYADFHIHRQKSLQALPPVAAIKTRTRAQQQYKDSIANHRVTFAIGPAGTGKTYIAVAMGVKALLEKSVERIVVTRPVIEAGESLGFLPGKLQDKFDPYLAPLRRIFHERMGQSHYEGMLKSGRIVAAPLAFMRGETFEQSYILVDEAQNMTANQFKLVLTRIGRGSTLVLDGDPDQTDLPTGSGLMDAARRLRQIRGINVVRFDLHDVVRDPLITDILEAYSN